VKYRTTLAFQCALLAGTVLMAVPCSAGTTAPDRRVLIRDITSVEGVRDNMLVGYGLVVGLNRTGDSQQTYFTVQTLANAMQKMGVLISPSSVEVKNVASVFITASLPPFSRPGGRIDVTVSSVGDAKSLVGGVLLMSALHGPDGQIYAEAQGPLVMGGYTAGSGTNGKEVNSTTVGAIPNGGIVERDTSVDLHDFKIVSLLLRNPDFTTAKRIADAVNDEFQKPVATTLDSSRVDISVADAGAASVPLLISRVQNLLLSVSTAAKIVVNERTGTIVLGGDDPGGHQLCGGTGARRHGAGMGGRTRRRRTGSERWQRWRASRPEAGRQSPSGWPGRKPWRQTFVCAAGDPGARDQRQRDGCASADDATG